MRALIIVVILVALGSGGWYGYRYWMSPPDQPSYRTAEVKRGNVVQTVSATGTVEPLVNVLVGSQVSGTITRWYADFNQQVKEGFVLAELDQDRFKAQVEQRHAAVAVAKARVEEAQARLSTAKLEREQLEYAFQRQAATDFEVKTAQAAEEAALAALHAAEAQLEADQADERMAEIELSKTVIASPIDGVVISRDVDAGQTVAASLSAPTLFTIANDLTKMRVNAAVNETDIGVVHEGMEAEFRVDAYPNRRYRGRVSQVRYAQTVVENVVTYTTLVDVDNPDLSLRPGMSATIMFEVAKAEDVLMVPNAALRFDPQTVPTEVDWRRPGRGMPIQPRVFRLDGSALVEVPVELGLNNGQFTEVRSDVLSQGDPVVVDKIMVAGGGRSLRQRMPRL
jgi:HlyD family secretion protein